MKDSGSKELRCFCPFCDSLTSSGKRIAKFYVNEEKGVYQCKHCDKAGASKDIDMDSLEIFSVSEPKEFKDEVYDECLPVLPPNASEYVSKRLPKASVAELETYGIRWSEEEKAIAFPSFDFDNNFVGLKYRYIDDNSLLRWKHEPGSTGGLYTLEGKGDKLLIVEGQFDAISAKLCGFNGWVLALETTSIRKELIPYINQKFKNVFLCLDMDQPGRESASQLMSSFRVKAVNITLPEGFKDLNEMYEKTGRESTSEFIKISTQSEVEKQTISIRDSLDKLVGILEDKKTTAGDSTGWPLIDQVLGGGLRRNEFTVINSYAKNGKSTFLNNLAFNLIKQGHKVALASFEMDPEREVYATLFSIAGEMDVTQIESHNVRSEIKKILADNQYLHNLLIFRRFGVTQWTMVEDWIKSVIEHHKVDFIFLDHAGFMVNEMSNAAQNQQLAMNIKKITNDYGTHIITVVQAPKPGKDKNGEYVRRLSTDTSYGGGAWAMNCNHYITVQIDSENENILNVIVKASRYRKAITNQEVKLKYDRETGRLSEN